MAEANLTPEEHSSVVGGSTAARRLNCPRSYALEQLAPPDAGNAYAREGTALHEMMAVILGQDKKPDELLPFTFAREKLGAEEAWSLTIDDDLWYELGQPALDAFDDFVDQIEAETGEPFEYAVETRCAMPGIDNAFGTTDVIWRAGELSGVWDWKFGRTPVSAEENSQLKFYGRAAANTLPTLFGAPTWAEMDQTREIVLSIMQPQASSKPSHFRTTLADLEKFRVDLRWAVYEAQVKGLEAKVEKGYWCAFATCKVVCPLFAGRSLEFGKKMAALAEARDEAIAEKELPKKSGYEAMPSFMDNAAELLDLAEMAEEFAKAVFGAAHALIESGAEVDGWQLKAKRSAGREWAVDEETIKAFMKNRRYVLDEYMPRKLVTMPQAEKLLARDGKKVPETMVRQKPSSGTSLARVEDGVASVETRTAKMAALADKLSVYQTES